MQHMKKRVICLIVIGKKYERFFSRTEKQFYTYADKCNADIKIFTSPLDKEKKRSILAQKLLIPSQVEQYDEGLFLDLDILISEQAPDIFSLFSPDKSFAAVLDPRGENIFNETWKHIPRILEETTLEYFKSRNFPTNALLQGSINGGVFMFRPSEVSSMFSDYYYSDHQQGKLNSFEETPMAYLTQTKGIFQPLPPQFNAQVLYYLKGTKEGKKIIDHESKIPYFIRKKYYKFFERAIIPTRGYKQLIQNMLKENYFVHFAGNYPLI